MAAIRFYGKDAYDKDCHGVVVTRDLADPAEQEKLEDSAVTTAALVLGMVSVSTKLRVPYERRSEPSPDWTEGLTGPIELVSVRPHPTN